MIHTCLSTRIDQREVSHVILAQGGIGNLLPTRSQRKRHEFVDLFVQLLRDAFAGRISERSDEQVTFLGSFERGAAEVTTRMKGPLRRSRRYWPIGSSKTPATNSRSGRGN